MGRLTRSFVGKSWSEMAGDARIAAGRRAFKFIISILAVNLAMIASST